MMKHKCKLCFRKFSNGRALGGHVRSHMMNLYPPQKLKFHQEQSEDEDDEDDDEDNDESLPSSISNTTSSSEEEDNDDDEDDEHEEDEEMKKEKTIFTKRIRSSRISGTTNQTPKFKKDSIFMLPNCEKDEKSPLMEAETEQTEEDVAYCLMLLSRDKWTKTVPFEDDDDDDDDHGVGAKVSIKTRSIIRGKYRCETCEKVFRSYQALGGHRASHKRIKLRNLISLKQEQESSNVVVVDHEMVVKLHECPVCFKVFSSGQALGGHKRSHNTSSLNLSSSTTITSLGNNKVFSRSNGEPLIDLNLPAPIDDEDDDSQVQEFSLVYEGTMIH